MGGDGGGSTDGGMGGDGGGSTDGGGMGGGTDWASLQGDLISTFCQKLEECAPLISVILEPGNCVDQLTMQVKPQMERIQAAIDDGSLTFDASKATACLQAIRTASCDEFLFDPDANLLSSIPACRETIGGSKAAGEACRSDIECANDLYCDTSMSCPGVCAAPIAAGMPCRDGQQCAGSNRCFISRSSTDGMGTCTAPVGEGESCNLESGPPCGGALQCRTTGSGTSGTCQKEIDIALTHSRGETCSFMAGLCESGLACYLMTGATSGTCNGNDIAEGMPCPLAVPDPCDDGLYCDGDPMTATMGTCKKLPAAGEPCGQLFSPFGDGPYEDGVCGPGLLCDLTATSPVCVAPKANGESCQKNLYCASGYCHMGSGASGTCADWPDSLCE